MFACSKIRYGEPRRLPPVDLLLARPHGAQRALDLIGVGVSAFAEQRHHLRLGDLGTNEKIWHGGKAASHPNTGRFALLAVVRAEVLVAAVGRVLGSNLRGQ
jgi:hypothetical protein